MTDLMSLLFDYAQVNRFAGYIDSRAYRETERLEEKNLEALKRDLSAEGLAALERYQDACLEERSICLEAMFQAGFSIARELRG